MAEFRDASMARNVKRMRPLRSDDKTEVLRKLQGSIHFEKTLPASSVGMAYALTLPAWFIEKHGDKIRKSVILRSESSAKAWNVNLNFFFRNPPQVKFAGGWREFVRFNDLSERDSLIFSLKEISEFEVYVFRRTAGNPKQFPCQAPRKRSNGAELAQKQAKRSHECRDEQLAADGNFKGLARKKTIGEEHSASDSSHSQATSCSLSSCSIDLHQILESENPGQHTSARMKKDNEFQAKLAPEKRTRNSQLPSFSKKLTVSNFCRRGIRTGSRLEIPPKFWKTYSSRLCSLVKLQGIREESPIRTVACSLSAQDENQHWRLFLRAGWNDFIDENNLKVGQELEFTLAGESFFVVRRVKYS